MMTLLIICASLVVLALTTVVLIGAFAIASIIVAGIVSIYRELNSDSWYY